MITFVASWWLGMLWRRIITRTRGDKGVWERGYLKTKLNARWFSMKIFQEPLPRARMSFDTNEHFVWHGCLRICKAVSPVRYVDTVLPSAVYTRLIKCHVQLMYCYVITESLRLPILLYACVHYFYLSKQLHHVCYLKKRNININNNPPNRNCNRIVKIRAHCTGIEEEEEIVHMYFFFFFYEK